MRRDLQQLIATLEAETLRVMDESIIKAQNVAAAIEPIVEAGFRPVYTGVLLLQLPYFNVCEAQLPEIAKITGHFDPDRTSITPLKDGRSRKVEFTVRPASEKYASLRFKYKGLLPQGAKCKIRTTISKSVGIVCES